MAEKILKQLIKSPEHHAYLFVGKPVELFNLAEELVNDLPEEVVLKADIWRNFYSNFGIDDARNLKEIHNNKKLGSRKVFIIAIETITREAQNSLLKLLEDPSLGTHFYVFVPAKDILFDTLLSRFWVVESENLSAQKEDLKDAKDFVSSSMKERFEMIEPIVSLKDKTEAINFLNNLEVYLHNLKDIKTYSQAFDEILMAKKYLKSRSPSVKMILEHICCII